MPELFTESPPLSAEDQRLVAEYERIGRPSDDLPYSHAFDELIQRLHLEGETRTPNEILKRIFSLRKRGQLPRSLGQSIRIGNIPEFDIRLAEDLLKRTLGPIGSRDRLPYTQEFDRLHIEFNQQAEQPLDKHKFWRLIARISK